MRMLKHALWAALLILSTQAPASAQDKKFSIKTADTAPPKELSDSIRKLLGNNAVQFFDPAGTLICEIWFCKELPSDGTAEQLKNGLTYRELKETQVIGAVRFDQAWFDYRKQKVKTGVYTLRLGFQPPDGDHAGKSQFTEFLVLSAATKDSDPDAMTPKALVEMSSKSIGTGHPAVFMLFPNSKPGKTELESKAKEHWVVNTGIAVQASGMRGLLGIGLTLVGEADE
jgi:hypothetical protein